MAFYGSQPLPDIVRVSALSSDATVLNSTTLADSGIEFDIAAGECWLYMCTIFVVANINPDWKLAFAAPANVTVKLSICTLNDDYKTSSGVVDLTTAFNGINSDSDKFLQFYCVAKSTTGAGKVKLQFAQNLADDVNPTTIKAGSGIVATRLI